MISEVNSTTSDQLANLLSSKFDISEELLQDIVKKALSLSSGKTNEALEKVIKEQFKNFNFLNIPNIIKNVFTSKFKLNVTVPQVDKSDLSTLENQTTDSVTTQKTSEGSALKDKIFTVLQTLTNTVKELKNTKEKGILSLLPTQFQEKAKQVQTAIPNFIGGIKDRGRNLLTSLTTPANAKLNQSGSTGNSIPMIGSLMTLFKQVLGTNNNSNQLSPTNLGKLAGSFEPGKPEDEAVSRIDTKETTIVDIKQGSYLENLLRELFKSLQEQFKNNFEELNKSILGLNSTIKESGGGGGDGFGLMDALMMRGMGGGRGRGRGRGGASKSGKTRRPGTRTRATRMATGRGLRGAGRGLATAGRGALRSVPLVGGVIGAGLLASDLSSISEQEKSGEISKQEAYKAKGGALGGTGGALAGAAGGAALGSMIFPGVGTVIGGIAGGLIGSFAGEAGGEAIGSAMGPGEEDFVDQKIKKIKENPQEPGTSFPHGIEQSKFIEEAEKLTDEERAKINAAAELHPVKGEEVMGSIIKQKTQQTSADIKSDTASTFGAKITPTTGEPSESTAASIPNTEDLNKQILEEIASNTEQTNQSIANLTKAIFKLAKNGKGDSTIAPIVVNQQQQQNIPSASQVSDSNLDSINSVRQQFLV